MAEPFGIAASAFQVAGAGIALANTLKAYTDSVRKAEKQLKPVADHVKLTADVLTNVGCLLKNDDIRGLYTKELLGSTSNALGGCRTAFEELEKFISKLLKPNEGTGGKITIQTSARLTLYFKQKELDVLQAHLERFKTSLDLVLGVLNLASSARSAKDTSVIAEMKADIKRLIQAEHEAKKREASLVLTPVESNASMESASSGASRELPIESSTARALPVVPLVNAMAVAGAAQRSINIDAAPRSVRNDTLPHPSTPEDTVLQYLSKCADAAAQLTADIEKAIAKWNDSAEYESQCLADAFQSTATAMHALARYEQRALKTKAPPPPYIRQNQDQASLEDIFEGYSRRRRGLRVQGRMQKSKDKRLPGPAVIRRRSRSSSYDYRRERRRRSLSSSHSRSRSRSESRSRKPHPALAGVGVVGGLAGNEIKKQNKNETVVINGISPPRRNRPRSRSRRDRRASSEDERHRDMDYRNYRIAQAGLASAAVAGMWERERSRSSGRYRERSRSRTRLGIPIAAAGLGGAALAGINEKNKAKKEATRDEAIDRGFRRSRSCSRSRRRSISSENANLSLPSNEVLLFTPNLDTLDAAESPLLNPTQDTSSDVVTFGDFALNESGAFHSDPDHSPHVSPYFPPPPTIPPSTGENCFDLSATLIGKYRYQTDSKDVSSTLAEQFPDINNQNRPNVDIGDPCMMSPPEISIDFSPPTRAGRTIPDNHEELISSPTMTQSHHRVRAKSDSPLDFHDRRSSEGSQQRDDILNLAEPERSPSNGTRYGRVQKHSATFQCNLCTKRFTRAYNIRSHLRTHTDERPFVCTVCGKAFARQHDRKRHQGLHSRDNREPGRSSLVDYNGSNDDEYYTAAWDTLDSWAVVEIDTNNAGVEEFDGHGCMEHQLPVEVDQLLRQWTTLEI